MELINVIATWLQNHPQTWPVILLGIQHVAPDSWKINQVTRDHNNIVKRLRKAVRAFNQPVQSKEG